MTEYVNVWQIILGLFGLAGGILGGIATWKNASTESRHSIAQQYEAMMKRQDERISHLESWQRESEVRERIRDDYIYELRQHIAEGKPPPPPAWPSALLHRENSK